MLQPTDDLTIRLSINEWNQVLGVLGQEPYVKVASLIQRINVQAQQQAQSEEPQLPVPPTINGPEQRARPGRERANSIE